MKKGTLTSEALTRVAAGGTALDPEVVTQLFGASRRVDGLAALTAREREVLTLMAEGRTNGAIAVALVVSWRRTPRRLVQEAMRRLALDPDQPAGIVLTKVPHGAPGHDLYTGYSR